MKNERGVALVITLFLMAALSALAVSLVFLSETETSASRNYKTMSQARYAAEAGVHRAVNYLLLDTFKANMTSNLASFDLRQSPVTYNGSAVVLSATSGVSSNYPDATVAGAFGSTVKGALAVGTGYAAYSASATLLSMRTVDVYGSNPDIIMTWRITGTGTVCKGTATCTPSDTSLGTLDVTATLERDLNNAQTYAVFATYDGCAAVTVSGNVTTNSYNSSSMATTPPPTTDNYGGIGTNGNLDVSGSVAINGTLSTPRTGAGTCSSSNPNAITGSGSWSYQGTVPLPQAVAYPAPTIPAGIPTTSVTLSSGMTTAVCQATLALNNGSNWSCAVDGVSKTVTLTPLTLNPLMLGNLTVGSNTTLVIGGGSSEVMNVNSFLLGSNAKMSLLSSPSKTTVTMNIAGQSLSGGAVPLDLSGGGTVNDSYDPTRLQILYAGTDQLITVGNNTLAATIYAPNASVKTTGSGNLYGSVLSSRFTDTGGAQLHYDTSLQKKYQTLGNYAMSSFSWRKY